MTERTEKRGRKRQYSVKESAQRQTDAVNRRQQVIRRALQEIGEIPPCMDPARRARAAADPQYHAETYHPTIFNLPWAPYHDDLFALGRRVVFEGGWHGFAMPRGGGKSRICEVLCEWAVFHGHKRFPILIGGTNPKAKKRLKNLKIEWRINQFLFEDFPDICFPMRALGPSASKAGGQLCGGHRTMMEWKDEEVVLPTIHDDVWEDWLERSGFKESPKRTSGSRLAVCGITGDIRGFSETSETGEGLRPDLAIPDDPQTRESARSPVQCQTRLETLTGDIAFLNDPQVEMSVLMPATVIRQHDMVDRILDRDIYPQWRGVRHKMLEAFPTHMEMWDQYAEIYRECLRADKPITRANDYYEKNRKKMDLGAVVTWEHRYSDKEISAVQHAMNLFYRDESAFFAEAQNSPRSQHDESIIVCTPEDIVDKQSHLERGRCPQYVEKIVAHIDVQQDIAFWMIAGFSKEFEGSILDYGSFPDQGRHYFAKADDLKGFAAEYPNLSRLEARIYAGLTNAIDLVLSKRFIREDGLEMRLDRVNVDDSYMSDTVRQVCREHDHSSLLITCKGVGVRAKDKPMSERPKKEGETKGHYWSIRPLPDSTSLYALVDSNYWKSQVHIALSAARGQPGCLTLFKAKPSRHGMLGDHLNSEYPVRVRVERSDGENIVDEWDEKPGRPDNDFFDNAYNVLAAASMEGCIMPTGHAAAIEDGGQWEPAEVYSSEDFQ